MRFILSTVTFAAAVLVSLNAAVFAVPSAAQSVLPPVAQVTPIGEATAQSTTTPAVVADHAEPIVETTPTTSLADLVSGHMDATLADDESKCLAVAVYFESKGEPLAGQLAVAQVMLNRTETGRFPETVCGVIRQPGQFSFVHHGQYPHIAEDSRAWRTACAISQIARAKLWQPVVGHAIFFHAKRVSPHWHAVQVAALGNHIFYR
jgi:spore germination cell wall hydrolase CwlJ-like protein